MRSGKDCDPVLTSPGQSGFRILRAAGLAVVVLSCASAYGETLDPVGFLRDYRGAVKRLKESNAHPQLAGDLQEVFLKKDGTVSQDRRFEFSYAAGRGREKLIQVGKTPEYFERVIVTGEGRRYSLRRTSPEGDYLVAQLNGIDDNFQTLVDRRRRAVVNSAFSAGEVPLDALVESPHFRIRKVETEGNDGHRLVRVEFVYQPNAKNQFNTSGWFRVDPSLNWAVIDYEVRNTSPTIKEFAEVASGSAQYAEKGRGFPLPVEFSHVEKDVSATTPRESYRLNFHANQASQDEPAEAGFSLAAFGLGDLEQPTGSGHNSFGYWALGVGIVALVGSALIKRRTDACRR